MDTPAAATQTDDTNMAFLTKEDLRSAIREYQLDAITDNDDTIVQMAIDAAIEQAKSMLTPNDMKIWDDGRPHYDVDAIFTQENADRNALMLANTKTVALWHLIQLCNTGLNYDDAKDRYDRAIKYLKDLGAGIVNSGTLPKITADPPPDQQPFYSGSRAKFSHDY
ncbi:hypothetical protein ACFS5N_16315 [Mucilaginibacter ximonensis]|uniref:DUF1320 domain-containing protein n=1 Tax=Mucilaginibacter ximonensis TaxID=538021 RepID=A0ABW5YFB3_9SPHI